MAQFTSLNAFMKHQARLNAALNVVDEKVEFGSNDKVSAQSANVGLFTSMLQDAIVRDHIVVDGEHKLQTIDDSIDVDTHKGVVLKGNNDNLLQQQALTKFLDDGYVADFTLANMLWPSVLSQYNDAYRIDDEVVANASYLAQENINNGDNVDLSEQVVADPLKLYDILQTLKMRNAS